MIIQIGDKTKALDQRDRAAIGLRGPQPGLIEREALYNAMEHPQHQRYQLRLRGRQ